jgi:hypothetical protein
MVKGSLLIKIRVRKAAMGSDHSDSNLSMAFVWLERERKREKERERERERIEQRIIKNIINHENKLITYAPQESHHLKLVRWN